MEKKKNKTMYSKVSNIKITSIDGKTNATLNNAYTKSNWSFTTKESHSPSNTKGYNNLKNLHILYNCEKHIGMLIDINRQDMLRPLEAVYTTRFGPYATKHMFRWAVSGCASSSTFSIVKVEENDISFEDKFIFCFTHDFEDNNDSTKCNSIEYNRWLEKVRSSISILPNKQFKICLSVKDNAQLPNHYDQAMYRIISLKKKF